jgi:hypothetical protein
MKTRINKNRPRKIRRGLRTRKRNPKSRKRKNTGRRKTLKGGATEIISIPLLYVVAAASAFVAAVSAATTTDNTSATSNINVPNPLNQVMGTPFSIPSIFPVSALAPADPPVSALAPAAPALAPAAPAAPAVAPGTALAPGAPPAPVSTGAPPSGPIDNNYAKLRDRNIDMIEKKYVYVEMIVPPEKKDDIPVRKNNALEKNRAAFESAPSDNGQALEKMYSDIKSFITIENNPNKVYDKELDGIRGEDISDEEKRAKIEKSAEKKKRLNAYIQQIQL